MTYMARNFRNWTTISCILANFLLRMRSNARILLPVKFVTPNLNSPFAISYSNTKFGGASAKIYTCFQRKTASDMQNFQNLEARGGRGEDFLTKPPRGTSLADFTRFEPLCMRIRSRVFCSRRDHEKRDTTKSYREVIFHLFAGNFPLNQI